MYKEKIVRRRATEMSICGAEDSTDLRRRLFQVRGDAFVMVVDRHSQSLLGIVLANDKLRQQVHNLSRVKIVWKK